MSARKTVTDGCDVCGRRHLPEGVTADSRGCVESCRADYAKSLEPRAQPFGSLGPCDCPPDCDLSCGCRACGALALAIGGAK